MFNGPAPLALFIVQETNAAQALTPNLRSVAQMLLRTFCSQDADVRDLNEALKPYFASNPYELRREPATGGLQEVLVVRVTKPLPDQIEPIVGDAVHNLRSSLDHLAVALATKNGAKRTNDVYFPF